MSFNICSISGNICQQPVISRSGHVFERRLIEKIIDTTGLCPITNETLSKSDLIEVKIEFFGKPRNVAATSIPGMFHELQTELEGIIQETYNNKKQLEMAKQELSHAMYRYDAACRVITNLIKERDNARDELLQITLQVDEDFQEASESSEKKSAVNLNN
jgi:pre-mRNA-processing factor 19